MISTAALIFLICSVAGHGLDDRMGPLADKILEVPEGTAADHPVYQFKSANEMVTSYLVTGETDGKIAISPEGWLYLQGALDWATKRSHSLQVAALADTETVDGPYSVTIIVKDINDNRPTFNQTEYSGVVREHTSAGLPFMRVFATDLDDPETPNAKLSYSIAAQIPDHLRKPLFQIDSATGEISTTPEGENALRAKEGILSAEGAVDWRDGENLKRKFDEYCAPPKAIPYELNPFYTCVERSESRRSNPMNEPDYILIIKVEDLEGKSENAFSGNTRVNIMVQQNLWVPPAPIRIQENLVATYPMEIAKVQTNELGAHYKLAEKERYPSFPFEINEEGRIFVTGPLDREENRKYGLVVFARDEEDVDLEKPMEIHIYVEDINDHAPICEPLESEFEVQENEPLGNQIGILQVYDLDEENSTNTLLSYSILNQTPVVPSAAMFSIDNLGGKIQIANTHFRRKQVPEYHLTVKVSDQGGLETGLSTECKVIIKIIDINNEIPVFEINDYGEKTVVEDTPVGTTLLTILAKDADDPGTGSSKVVYHIAEGDAEGVFAIETDEATNEGRLHIVKPLDFEIKSVYNLRIDARNPEPLVEGVEYNASSTAVVNIHIDNIDEPPVFDSDIFQVTIAENVTIGSTIVEMNAKDPEGKNIRFKLEGDEKNWLEINTETGEIKSKAKLDREEVEEYIVKVTAYEKDSPDKMTEKEVTIHLTDVNDNIPKLTKVYSFMCVSKPEPIVLTAVDRDGPPFGEPFTFSLSKKHPNLELKTINGNSAMLQLKSKRQEANTFTLPITIKDASGLGVAQNFEVQVCNCTELGYCYTKPEDHVWKLGLPTTVGILAGTLGFIALVLIIVFHRIKKNGPKNKGTNEMDPMM